MRKQYTRSGLAESDCLSNPIEQFRNWFDEMVQHNPVDWFEPNAMTLATADQNGNLAARIVLLKGFDESGFVFYTNYESAKGKELAANPKASLAFYWPFMERQVRIDGSVQKVSREQSDKYFHLRPRGSQLGAVVSPQSQVLASRTELETKVAELEQQLAGQTVPLPDHWGGYVVYPTQIEFWQGRENRLHDRIQYVRHGDGWKLQRLAP
ncbi:MAG: pyridoxamine 5'-phosphate oxidase [Pirellulaceae bacterium]